jgi:hypothetical protein
LIPAKAVMNAGAFLLCGSRKSGGSRGDRDESTTFVMDPVLTPATDSTPSPVADDAARSAWLQTGTFPGTPSAEHDAESAPAKPAEQAPSTEGTIKADSEPAAPADKGKALKVRNAELEAENQRLSDNLRTRKERLAELQRLDALERAPKQDAHDRGSSPPAPTKAEWQRYAEHPEAPKEEAFERYGDYTAAMSLFIGKQLFAEHEQAQQARATQQQTAKQLEQKFTTSQERFQAFVEKDPGVKDRIRPELLDIVPISLLGKDEPAGPHNFLAEEVATSEVNGALLEYFSTPEGAMHWGRLMQQSPDAIVREVGRLEGRFLSRDTASPVRPPKTISTAPEPPETLGKRPADPVPDAEAALARGDFASYQDAANRRDWNARRTA